jgi:Trk K+ transport system NAD-binding subunit
MPGRDVPVRVQIGRHDISLSRRDRRIVAYLAGILVVVAVYTLVYDWGMRELEGRPHSIYRSLQAVVETMTTTGYGADAPWETPAMNLLVVAMQLTGIGLGFVTLRLVIIPLFTRAQVDLDERLPPLRDHLVVCDYRRDPGVLLDELDDLDVDSVLVTPDEATARRLSDAGHAAIHGPTGEPETFERAGIGAARAVLVDAGAETVDAVLTVRSLRPDVEVVALTDDGDLRTALSTTGADAVLSPHAVLGQRLGERAVASFEAALDDAVTLGPDVSVVERLVPHDSDLVGTALRDSGIRERTGATVVGAWIDGQLRLPPPPDAVIQPSTVLVVVGAPAALEDLGAIARPGRDDARDGPGRTVVLGAGEVGGAARRVFEDAGVETVTVDAEPGPDVDVVGDACEPSTLRAAGVDRAEAVVVGLPDDARALLTTALVRSLAPDVEVLVRVNDTDSTAKALRAGADYVLSVPRVSARMVAGELRGEDVLEPASQVRFARAPAGPFAGRTLAESGIYETTGCRVIAVADDDGVVAPVPPDRRLAPGDRLTVVGTDAAVRAFHERVEAATA